MADPGPQGFDGQPVFKPGGGVALIVIGVLILVPSGLCTAVMGIPFILDSTRGRGPDNLFDLSGALILVGLFGGIPMLIGSLLLWLGLRKRRTGQSAANG
ncbi:MAG TPA: hypothetical protein VEU47_01550 [Candidatus Cybelea sp.]|nr:hypothetical protein [Candidatus Cybelea sp.]